MSEVIGYNRSIINLYDNPIFKKILKNARMTVKDLKINNKDLEINPRELNFIELDESYIERFIFEKRLMKFLNDNNLYPCDDVKELIIEDNFHYFDKLTKFQDLVDQSYIYPIENFIFNHITDWIDIDGYDKSNAAMKYACETLADNSEFVNTLINTSYYGERNGGYCYIILNAFNKKKILHIIC